MPDEANPFEEFWTAWPHKVSKKDAARRFKNLSKKDQRAAIAAIPNYVKQVEAQRSAGFNRQYKDPAAWLNGRKWEDTFAVDMPRKSLFAS